MQMHVNESRVRDAHRKFKKRTRKSLRDSHCGVPFTSATMLQEKRVCRAVCLYRFARMTCAISREICEARATWHAAN